MKFHDCALKVPVVRVAHGGVSHLSGPASAPGPSRSIGRETRGVLDVYGTHLHLATTRKDWRRLAREYDNLTEDNDSPGSTTLFVDTGALNRMHLAIWIDVKGHAGDTAELLETAAHEATHAAAQLLDHIGHPPGDSEALAYLSGWLTRWLWTEVAT